MKYRSPGFKSDILRGNFLPQRTATSRIIAYRFGYVKTELYPNPFHMPDYFNIHPAGCQCFSAKKFVKIVKIFQLFFMHYFLCATGKKALNIGVFSTKKPTTDTLEQNPQGVCCFLFNLCSKNSLRITAVRFSLHS